MSIETQSGIIDDAKVFIGEFVDRISTGGDDYLNEQLLRMILQLYEKHRDMIDVYCDDSFEQKADYISSMLMMDLETKEMRGPRLGMNKPFAVKFGHPSEEALLASLRTAIALRVAIGDPSKTLDEYFSLSVRNDLGRQFLQAIDSVKMIERTGVACKSSDANTSLPLKNVRLSAIFGDTMEEIASMDTIPPLSPDLLRTLGIVTYEGLLEYCKALVDFYNSKNPRIDESPHEIASELLRGLSLGIHKPVRLDDSSDEFDDFLLGLLNGTKESKAFGKMLMFGENYEDILQDELSAANCDNVNCAKDVKKIRTSEIALTYVAELAFGIVQKIKNKETPKPAAVPDIVVRLFEELGSLKDSTQDKWDNSFDRIYKIISDIVSLRNNNFIFETEDNITSKGVDLIFVKSVVDAKGILAKDNGSIKYGPDNVVIRCKNSRGMAEGLSEVADRIILAKLVDFIRRRQSLFHIELSSSQDVGDKLANAVIFGAHGFEDGVLARLDDGNKILGDSERSKKDIEELVKSLKRLGNPTLILHSCSTDGVRKDGGINFADFLRDVTGCKVIAPHKRIKGTRIETDGSVYFEYYYDDIKPKPVDVENDTYFEYAGKI